MSSLSQVVLITGANSGIGYEAVKAFLKSPNPYHILLGSRSPEKGSAAISSLQEECPETTNTVETIEIDLTSDDSITKAYERVSSSPGRLDVLVNNAGATFDLAHLSNECTLRSSFTCAYNTNVAGPHVLTSTFMPLLLTSPSPRLIFISGLSHITQASESYFPTPPQPAGWPKAIDFETIGYRCSKTALNMLMLDWNHKLKADGVKVWGVMPGFLATNLGGRPEWVKEMGGGHASIGGEFVRDVVEGERDGDVGRIVKRGGGVPW
ncbi:NAD(P)-binding protein [Aspergillus sclerotiicarbonarius CBS 121057]|uniref:NAD(P)-binding protein n=1 Tax=Aspergillus sclerotiicarbonarius (strain CBS 121057 / IBT 28362) TaxID=1448318 RepID=A0A319EMN1_ASPSB|nr:NAD(P)-binding protein [Aspergillus sclerotiicarbonarius CBS 121057]